MCQTGTQLHLAALERRITLARIPGVQALSYLRLSLRITTPTASANATAVSHRPV
jgi:hypothetical protein